ncbi:hypothetical protein [Pedobacter zeae]|uniref:Uncharacterized protein n=1 Tax=Pedobacter zeae TaxID=1737356 RepID=A0A7W6P5K5_9SPHI|nr:hypothetical protein [Pedobacter zeae]MBB4108142.1 hypothetical protein [Pedobacter zeae]GGG94714.1 hypothetical protein GCM10007422_05230 [Pedobacter zeae]
MATSLSPSLDDGFDKAKKRVRSIYPDYDNRISRYTHLNYNENDIEYDIRRLWSEFPTVSGRQSELLEQDMIEMIGLILLTRFYEGQDRFSYNQLQNSFGDILRKLWERFTGF